MDKGERKLDSLKMGSKKVAYIVTVCLSILAAMASLKEVQAQRFAPGYCPTVTAQENFDKTKFFGNWIEVEKTPSIFDLMMRCLVVDYSDDQDNTVNVVVRGISLAGLPLTVNGDGLLQDVHRSGFYSIRYGFGVPFQGTLTTIIDTDYEDYAVVYSCTNSLLSGVFHSEYIWVLSRSGKISNPTRQNIYEKLDKLQINRSGLTMSDRSSCPTNSSTVARESDKDLAGSNAASSNLSGSPSSSAASGDSSAQQVPIAAPVASLEKVNAEPTQKSVVVPLLYDPPSPASSSSVGSIARPSLSKAPPAPVENKVPLLPIASGVAASKPQAAAPSISGSSSPAAAPKASLPVAAAPAQPASGSSAQAVPKPVAPANNGAQAAPANPLAAIQASSSAQKPVDQQAGGLIAKIQPKL